MAVLIAKTRSDSQQRLSMRTTEKIQQNQRQEEAQKEVIKAAIEKGRSRPRLLETSETADTKVAIKIRAIKAFVEVLIGSGLTQKQAE